MSLHLADWTAGFSRPEFDDSGPAPGHENLSAWQVSQTADPVLVSVVDGPDQLAGPQVPLFDAEVPGGAEEGVPAQRQTLDPVVVGRVQIGGGRDHTTLALANVEHLQIKYQGKNLKVYKSDFVRNQN